MPWSQARRTARRTSSTTSRAASASSSPPTAPSPRSPTTRSAAARAATYGSGLVGRQTSLPRPGFYDPAAGSVFATNAAGRFAPILFTSYDALGNGVKTAVRNGTSTFINEYKAYDNLGRLLY